MMFFNNIISYNIKPVVMWPNVSEKNYDTE
jgi:hypothetical protein